MSLAQYLIKNLNINRATAHWWLSGKRPVSPKHAPKLEALFGIDARRFVWPSLHGNPWPDVKKIYDTKITQNPSITIGKKNEKSKTN